MDNMNANEKFNISMTDAMTRFACDSARDAIRAAERAGLIICKHADPVDDAVFNISGEWALDIAREDSSLVYFVDGAAQVDEWAAAGCMYYDGDELIGPYGNERVTATIWECGCPYARAWCMREGISVRVS